MKLKVTQQDIEKHLGGYTNCPVALALKRQLNTHDVFVCNTHIRAKETLYQVSKSIKQFIDKVDHNSPLKPHTFILQEK